MKPRRFAGKWLCAVLTFTASFTTLVQGMCRLSEFQCSSGACIPSNRYCDGTDDCSDGSDEPVPCTNCNRTYYGQTGVKHNLRMLMEPFQRQMSFTCQMSFVAAGASYGDLVEINFLTFQLGLYHQTGNSSSCHQGIMRIEEDTPKHSIEPQFLLLQPEFESKSHRHRYHHRQSQASTQQTTVSQSVPSEFGGFCGNLVGGSAVFYGSGSNVTLTVSSPVASQANNFAVYLMYRFLSRPTIGVSSGQTFHYGDFVPGTYCDRVFTDCFQRNCRLQSPNYPGFYLRNITCLYHVKQSLKQDGLVAQIVLKQKNEYKINIHSGLPNPTSGTTFSSLTTECTADVVRIFDGPPNKIKDASVLQSFCGAGPLPEIVSSGPEVTIALFSAPYHQLVNTRMELDVSVRYAKPTELRMSGKTCHFTFDSKDETSGVLYAPRHTVPGGTTCTFHFRGRSKYHRVWLYFTSYFVPDRQSWLSGEKCDVSRLEIVDGLHDTRLLALQPSPNDTNLIGSFCEKSAPRTCSHAHDYQHFIPLRPCRIPTESYLSSGQDITLRYTIFKNSEVTPQTASWSARYEFVDTSQSGTPFRDTLCDRIFTSKHKLRGSLKSPQNVFYFGRGGSSELQCTYYFNGAANQRVRIKIDALNIRSDDCTTSFDASIGKYMCNQTSFRNLRQAYIRITEMWQNVDIHSGCFCANQSDMRYPLVFESVAPSVALTFTIKGMSTTEDFNDYSFEAGYEFFTAVSCTGDQVYRGYVGQADLSVPSEAEPVLSDTSINAINSHPLRMHGGSEGLRRCRWMIEAREDRFLYLKISGGRQSYGHSCGSVDKLIVYTGAHFDRPIVICAANDDVSYDENIEMFSPSWTNLTERQTHRERFLLETLCYEMSSKFSVQWIEITRPYVSAGGGHTMRNLDCLYECPELEACISPELWCDGIPHCPSGYDEKTENCKTFPFLYVGLAVTLTFLLLLGITGILVLRRLCVFEEGKQKAAILDAQQHKKEEDVPMDTVFPLQNGKSDTVCAIDSDVHRQIQHHLVLVQEAC